MKHADIVGWMADGIYCISDWNSLGTESSSYAKIRAITDGTHTRRAWMLIYNIIQRSFYQFRFFCSLDLFRSPMPITIFILLCLLSNYISSTNIHNNPIENCLQIVLSTMILDAAIFRTLLNGGDDVAFLVDRGYIPAESLSNEHQIDQKQSLLPIFIELILLYFFLKWYLNFVLKLNLRGETHAAVNRFRGPSHLLCNSW